jgi:hypothetical protein
MMKWLPALLLCAAGSTWAAGDNLRGRYYFGHEVESFRPCGSKKAYWVRGGDRTLQPLRQRAERLREMRGKPYQPIYLEATGTIDTKSPREGFARDYDGLVHLRQVARISNAIPETCRN